VTTGIRPPRSGRKSTAQAKRPRPGVIREGVASYLPDIDPEETDEWMESFDQLLERSGPSLGRDSLDAAVAGRDERKAVALPSLTSNRPKSHHPDELSPGSPATRTSKRRLTGPWRRWNDAIHGATAQEPGVGVGGNSDLCIVCGALRGRLQRLSAAKSHPAAATRCSFQGHASPALRTGVGGRLTTDQLRRFPAGAQPSRRRAAVVPAPRMMPTSGSSPRLVSMGLGPMNALYQARFNQYRPTAASRDTPITCGRSSGTARWTEPESRGLSHVAAGGPGN